MNGANLSNLSMLCDFYEFTMSNGYFKNGFGKKNVYFDMFFRSVPDGGGFAIAAGLAQLVEYINGLGFGEEDIAFLESKKLFDRDFLGYLRSFGFTGDIYAIPEGPVRPSELHKREVRRQSLPGPGDRQMRLHRQQHRAPRALRDHQKRRAGKPGTVHQVGRGFPDAPPEQSTEREVFQFQFCFGHVHVEQGETRHVFALFERGHGSRLVVEDAEFDF